MNTNNGTTQKQLAIFGVSEIGKEIFEIFGAEYVRCFVDVNLFNTEYCGLKVISFGELVEIKDSVIIVIVSTDIRILLDIKMRLVSENLTHYYIWEKCDTTSYYECIPLYYLDYIHSLTSEAFSFQKMITSYELKQYNNIALYCYPRLVNLLTIIFELNNIQDKLKYVIPSTKTDCDLRSFKDAESNVDCVVSVVKRSDDGLIDYLEQESERVFTGEITLCDFYNPERFVETLHCPKIRRFKDIHKGKRCFILGNGPSLHVEDLQTLYEHGEISFGCNGIYNVFDKTDWRPSYYCVNDGNFYPKYKEIIHNIDVDVKIVPNNYYDPTIPIVGEILTPRLTYYLDHFYSYYSPVNKDVSIQTFCNSASVITDYIIPIAIYMGFKEIYFIGVDHNIDIKGITHFYESDFLANTYDELYIAKWQQIIRDRTYESLESFSRKYGFRIYNATRGGHLEAYERVDFDSLFE